MHREKKTLINYAIRINIVQLLYCSGILYISRFDVFHNKALQFGLLILELFIWMTVGIMFVGKTKATRTKDAALYSIVSLSPIIFLEVLSLMLSVILQQENMNWAMFFFLGSVLNFWNKSSIILSAYIPSAYLIYAIHLIILFFVTFISSGIATTKMYKRQRRLEIRREERKKEEAIAKQRAKDYAVQKDKILQEQKQQETVEQQSVEQRKKNKEVELKKNDQPMRPHSFQEYAQMQRNKEIEKKREPQLKEVVLPDEMTPISQLQMKYEDSTRDIDD